LRYQKTPVYENWIKIAWVDSRIIKILKQKGRNQEAEFYQKELDDYKTAYNNGDIQTADYILEHPYVPTKK
jgi:hypothetical protein